MATDKKVWTFEEVVKHNKHNDCWLIMDGKVYDVSSYMDDHPGGDEVLLSTTGKDATNDFEDVGHSDSARKMLVKFHIGDIDMATVPLKRTHVSSEQATNNSGSVSNILKLLIPLVVLGLAFAALHFKKEQ
ncbi:hypothetical protein Leryth_019346 [Lithospermum erythrorhizon]|uniref:Oxidoreductase n=1 Tax=Lithospermum erythrorhizon TaxID=34254 RepID=A0AAV3RRC9_LITER|nr:hypothetical protein Leryth_019346 [Lithospermum erythrorhizon]